MVNSNWSVLEVDYNSTFYVSQYPQFILYAFFTFSVFIFLFLFCFQLVILSIVMKQFKLVNNPYFDNNLLI